MKKIIFCLSALFIGLQLAGCAVLLVGGGVVGGLAISEDTVKINIDASLERAWSISLSELSAMGTVDKQNKAEHEIEATVERSDITVYLQSLTENASEVRVKARKAKGLFPNIELAHKISSAIALRAKKR